MLDGNVIDTPRVDISQSIISSDSGRGRGRSTPLRGGQSYRLTNVLNGDGISLNDAGPLTPAQSTPIPKNIEFYAAPLTEEFNVAQSDLENNVNGPDIVGGFQPNVVKPDAVEVDVVEPDVAKPNVVEVDVVEAIDIRVRGRSSTVRGGVYTVDRARRRVSTNTRSTDTRGRLHTTLKERVSTAARGRVSPSIDIRVRGKPSTIRGGVFTVDRSRRIVCINTSSTGTRARLHTIVRGKCILQ